MTKIVIDAEDRLSPFDLRPLWAYRELLLVMTWRDISVRYKQTALGITWVIVQPLVTLAIFSLVFGVLLEVDSGDIPYPIFAFTALIPWRYFSAALLRGGVSLVSSAPLVSKVYFPRLIIPISAVIAPLVDFLFSFIILLIFMVISGFSPFTARFLLLPVFLLLALMTALGVTLWLSALNVYYRDVAQIVPFMAQLWLYLTPVIYPITRIPEQFRALYSLNPMVGVIESFRWALLDTANPDFTVIAISVVITLLILVSGLIFFSSMERAFGDII
jgi:lipopolysaccharide transport system permease protein